MAMTNEEYWAARIAELEKKWNRKSQEELEKELARYYNQALKRIQKDIEALYGRFAKDNELSYADAVKTLTKSEYNAWRMDIEDYVKQYKSTGDKAILKELNILSMKSRISRLDKLYSETLEHLADLAVKTEKATDKFHTEAYKDFYYHGVYEAGKKTGFKLPVSVVDDKDALQILRIPWSGKNYSQRIWTNNAKLGRLLKQTVTAAVHRGTDIETMSRFVAQKMTTGLSNARRLVRTELNFAENHAALDSIRDSGMKYYRFMATLDKRTSTQCREHDGHVYKVEDYSPGTNAPPLHPNCRSTISGSLKGPGGVKTGTRIARAGNGKTYHVPADMSYEDWKSVYVDKTKSIDEWKKATINKLIARKPIQDMNADDVIHIGQAINEFYNIEKHLGDKERIKKIFANFREMGGTLSDDQFAKGSSKKNKEMLRDDFAVYPKAWADYLGLAQRKLFTPKAQRGFFNAGAVMGNGKYYNSKLPDYKNGYVTIAMDGQRKTTPFHEIGHMVEFFNPNALRISKEFLAYRTKNEPLTRLKDLFPGYNYEPWEATKKDDFIHPYIGKDYTNATEVLSMGLEQIFEPTRFIKAQTINSTGFYDNTYATIKEDLEYLNLILGMIAMV